MKASIVRNMLFALLSLSSLLGLQAASAASAQEWRFKVFLDDNWIGYHDFRLTPEGAGGYRLDTKAQFDVKFLFINAYSYRHSNTEQWGQQCLRSIRARTDDNGREFIIRGSSDGDRFYIENGSDRTALSSCVMTFAYWNPEILKAKRLLNSQTGEYVDVDILPLGREQIPVRGQSVIANHYQIIAKNNAVIDLWYAAASYHWLALQSTTESGRKIRYLLD